MQRFVARENIRRLRKRLVEAPPEERPRLIELLEEAEAELAMAEKLHAASRMKEQANEK
jgi:hypothetical protein